MLLVRIRTRTLLTELHFAAQQHWQQRGTEHECRQRDGALRDPNRHEMQRTVPTTMGAATEAGVHQAGSHSRRRLSIWSNPGNTTCIVPYLQLSYNLQPCLSELGMKHTCKQSTLVHQAHTPRSGQTQNHHQRQMAECRSGHCQHLSTHDSANLDSLQVITAMTCYDTNDRMSSRNYNSS